MADHSPRLASAPPEKQIGQGAFYGIALLVLLLDQAVKFLVRAKMPLGGTIGLWPGVFHLTYTENPGMAFSLLEGKTGLLIVAALFVMGVIVWVQRRHGRTLPALLGLALALPLGGAAGNLIDRIVAKHVTDLFDFRLINFPIFNVADTAITVGVVLLALRTLTQKEPETTPTGELTPPSLASHVSQE